MGQSRSKENKDLSKTTHFTTKEISDLRRNVKEKDQNNITEDVFKDSVKQCMPTVSITDDVFLKRLYAAFGGEQDKSLDFRTFVDGLSVFMKGTPEEKLQLSFKLYDVDKDGFISKDELEQVLMQLSQMTDEEQDQSEEIQRSIDCMFADLDVDGDGKLSFEEYKLSAMKEPLVADFIERFLDQHNLSDKPKVPSRPTSVRSRSTSRSPNSQHRLSFRLSQAELLDYSHQQQILNNSTLNPDSNTTTTTPTNQSPRNSINSPLAPVGSRAEGSTTPPPIPATGMNAPTSTAAAVSAMIDRPDLPHRISRGGTMTSLDAAVVQM